MIIVYHEPASGALLIDFAKTVLNSKADLLVISKPHATALHHGVPEISFLSYKLGKKVLFVNNLEEAIDLLKPNKVYLVNPKAEKALDEVQIKDNDMIVFCGNPYINDKFENIKITEKEYPALVNLTLLLNKYNLL
jgi:SpoU rRNA methylase family enzyme